MPEELEQEIQDTPAISAELAPEVKTDAATEPATQEGAQGKPHNGVQKKIDKLMREKSELRGINDELRRRLDGIEQRIAAKPAAEQRTQEAADPKPDIKNFTGGPGQTYEDFTEQLSRWAARQEHKTQSEQREKQSAEQQEQERTKEVFDEYRRNAAAFANEHDDFDEVVANIRMAKPVAEAVQLALIEESDGPKLAYYLGQHPEECQKLSEMTPARAVTHLGRIAAKLEASPVEKPAPVEGEEEQIADDELPPITKARVQAPPAPIQPVRKTAPTATGLSDDLSIDSWMKRREKQIQGS